MTNGIFRDTKIVCDKNEITLKEAIELWNEYYPDAARHIKDGNPVEMVIWIEMDKPTSYGKHLQYISTDAESDGVNIWVTERKNFPKTITTP